MEAGCATDELLIHQMQSMYPERFAVLCRMHLSFLLDLTSEELNEMYHSGKTHDCKVGKRTFLPLHRKNKGTTESWDGSTVDSLVKCSGALEALIRFLGRDQNIRQEGLFRKSGKKSRQQELRGKINSNGIRVLEEESVYSVHDCASVLKAYLADLPEPLLSEAHYKAHCQIAGMCKSTFDAEQRATAKARQIQSLQLLFLLLPRENRRLLRELLILLNRVSQEHNGNLMDAMNLATMFAPHILCPRKMTAEDLVENSRDMSRAIAFMVENAAELFHVPVALLHDVRIALGMEGGFVVDDARNSTSMVCPQSVNVAADQRVAVTEVIEDDDDPDAVKTVITFCDRRPVGADKAGGSDAVPDTTAVALAELYAYVQAMPDSLKKKQLIKQFNRETGQGVSPLCSASPKKHQRSKSLRKTIKKHLFGGVGGHQRHRTLTDQNTAPPVCGDSDRGLPPVHPGSSDRQRPSSRARIPPTIRHPAYCTRTELQCASSNVVGCAKPVKPAWSIPPCISQSADCLLLFCHQRDTLHLNRTESELDSDSIVSEEEDRLADVRLVGIRALTVSFCDTSGLNDTYYDTGHLTVDDSMMSTTSTRSVTSFQSLYRLPRSPDNTLIYRETSV